MSSRIPTLFAGLLIAIGIAAGGFTVGEGLKNFRNSAGTVSVKGLAEREVKADLAIWNLRYTATGNELTTVQAKIEADTAAIKDFLFRQGFTAEEIFPQRPEVVDLLANQYRSQGAEASRFIISGMLLLRTEKVDEVQKTASLTGDLVKKNVVLDNSNASYNTPYYLFTRLNDIKPEMIAVATKNARDAAEQFAKDSGNPLGAIRSASQGYFSILPRNPIPGVDEATQILKTVRIVTSVDYALEK
jgi:hypothetical protein